MASDLSAVEVLMLIVSGGLLGWFGAMAIIRIPLYFAGRRAKLDAYAEMERRNAR